MGEYCVYIIASESKTIYVWVTSDIQKRILKHKAWFYKWFSKKYWCDKLVFYEKFNNIDDAIKSEKKLKNWRRDWKVNLIEKDNLYWEDLYKED